MSKFIVETETPKGYKLKRKYHLFCVIWLRD